MKLTEKRFVCGSLHYSVLTLSIAMGLILLGFFTYSFATACIGNIIPLRLKELGADNKTLAFILTTIGGIFNITICPIVSFKSDRYRSRWGRRIPYIIGTLPMFCGAMVLFGFSGNIAEAVLPFFRRWAELSPATMTILVIGVVMAVYQFFLMYVGSVIYYIYNDVIPPEFLARIVGYVQVACTLSATIFNFFVFKYSLSHFRWIAFSAAAIYAAGLLTMCLLLKEPEYPPVDEKEKKADRGISGIGTFLHESFSHPFYWYAFLGCGTAAVSGAIGQFVVFFHQTMGLSLAEIGNLNGVSGLIATGASMTAALTCTVFIDRYHPMRVYTVTLFLMLLPVLELFKWMYFLPPVRVYWFVTLFTGISSMAFSIFCGLSGMPMLMRVFPKSRFGQFCSAQAMLRSIMFLVLGFVAGVFVDVLKENLNLGESAFRYIFLWQAGWYVLAMVFFALMYREWLKLGGDTGFKAPAPWSPTGFEEMPVTKVVGPGKKAVTRAMYLLDVCFVLMPLGAVVFREIAKSGPSPESARQFFSLALPASLGALAVWTAVRLAVARDVRLLASGRKPMNGIPHHGLLWICGIRQAAMFCVCCWQSYATLGTDLSPKLWMFESLVSAVLPVLIFLYAFLERGFARPFEPEKAK